MISLEFVHNDIKTQSIGSAYGGIFNFEMFLLEGVVLVLVFL